MPNMSKKHLNYLDILVWKTFPLLKWIDVLTGLDRRMKITSTKILQFFDEVIQELLMARKKNSEQSETKDFVDLLLDYEEDSKLTGIELTKENIKGILMNVFTAGTDTTYVTVEWAMAELLTHPHVMKILQEEIRGVVGTTKHLVDENVINQMGYFNCVIKEVFRLHPPVAMSVPRVSSANAVVIKGYTVPAKTRVITNLWAINRDPEIWEKTMNSSQRGL